MQLYLSVTGIILSVILLFYNARNNRSTVYLGLFFLFLSLYGLYQYILLYSKSVTLIKLFLVNIAIVSSPLYLIGPMLYWYIRSVLTDDNSLKKKDIWHLLPMVIFFIAAFPNSFAPWNEKVEVAKAVVHDTGFILSYKATLISKIFSVAFEFITRPLLVLGYTLWSAGLCINYMRKGKVSAVLSTQLFMKRWLCLFLCFLLILEIFHIFLVIKAFEMHFSDQFFLPDILRFFDSIGIIGLLASPLFFPDILYGMPRMPKTIDVVKTNKKQNHLQQQQKKPNQNHFEESYLHSIGKKADLCMMEHQPYLQPDCNLSHLAKHVNLPVHHLAYYFREIKKQHFTDYRNEWRIKHAKKLIEEGKTSEITLEAIGMMSGFSSRNAFISDFKKVEGVSPGAFVSRLN